MDKASKLEKIAREIAICKICQTGTSGKAVAGEGNSDALLVLIGEAPGKTAGMAILEKNIPVLSEHGKIVEIKDRKCLLTLHPAAVLRFPKYGKIFKADLLKLIELIKS